MRRVEPMKVQDGRYTIDVRDGVMFGAPRALTELFGAAIKGRAVEAAAELDRMAADMERMLRRTLKGHDTKDDDSYAGGWIAALDDWSQRLRRRAKRLRKTVGGRE